MSGDCFGHFTPLRRTPCSTCALRGPCAVATDTGGFVVMPMPRYPRKTARIEERPDTTVAPLAVGVIEKLDAMGYSVKTASVRLGAATLARVDDGIGYTIVVEFPHVSARRLYDMSAAMRCSVSPMLTKSKHRRDAATEVIPSAERIRQMREVGSRAVCSTIEDAVDLIVEVARRVYGGEG